MHCFGKESRTKVNRKDRDLANVSPNTYSQSFADRKREAAYSLGARYASPTEKQRLVGPAPNVYDPTEKLVKDKAPQYRIGSEKRKATYDEVNAKLVPGTGTYDIKPMAINSEKSRFHMGQRLTYDSTTKFLQSLPGPGTH